MSLIVSQFQTIRFIQIMSLTFGLFTQVSKSVRHGPLVWIVLQKKKKNLSYNQRDIVRQKLGNSEMEENGSLDVIRPQGY